EPMRLMSTTRRNSSGVSRVAGTAVPMPALLTSTSTRPNPSIAACARARHWSGSATSVATHSALRPVSRTSCAASSSRSARRAASTTSAPASANPRANATPRPDDAPVTTATRPSRRNLSRTVMMREPPMVVVSRGVLPVAAVLSQPRRIQVHGGAVPARQQVELRAGTRQFVVVEVAGGGAFALVEVALLARGGEHLLQPHPGDDDVPGRLEVDRRVRQRRARVPVGPQGPGGLREPADRRAERLGVAGRLVAVAGIA